MLWGGWGERKRERAGYDGKGEGEERPLSYNVQFTGQICGSVVWLNQPTIWTLLRAVVKITPIPSSRRPPRAFHFFLLLLFL